MAVVLGQAAGRGGASTTPVYLIYLVASEKPSRWPLVTHNQRDVNTIQKLVSAVHSFLRHASTAVASEKV